MSSMTTNGGWNEYQRLVLAELERLNKRQEATEEKLSNIDRKLYALTERDISDLKTRMFDSEKKISAAERAGIGDEAVTKYRKWIIGGALLLLTSVIFPIVNLYLGN